MKYVVTGGAGFIGSHIVEELAARSHEVVILDDLSTGTKENIASFPGRENVTFAEGSITDSPFLKKTFEGADGVFHEAAIASVPRSVKNPQATHAVNLTGTFNVFSAARDCGVRKVVFASSAAVYGESPELPKREDLPPQTLSPYAVAKLAGEYYGAVFTKLYGVQCTALRYFNVFGPRQDPHSPYSGVISKFIDQTLAHRPLTIFGDGTQTRDFVYVKDVVQANLLAMEGRGSTGGIFNVALGTKINLLELADTIREITGIAVPVTFARAADGDIKDSLADITRARDVLGYAPEYTVRAGLEKTIEWYQSA